MDYFEALSNLRTNQKWGRKSPHKAVLMLTVIELYEQNVLSNNEIYYDGTLKSMFLKVWNRVLPDEPLFHPEAYLPFWYLQSDSFWHIVPVRGKEDILSLMRDTNIKPSEAKLNDCVKYAELDEDLYLLMTLPSGRSSLKRVLLETYTNLPEKQINQLVESVDNTVDYSASALSDYENLVANEKNEKIVLFGETDNELIRQFQSLSEDIQIVLNLQYYTFLKSHRSEREMFKEICPTIYDLFDKIVNHPVKRGDISPSFGFTYDNFLSDLKIALMSEDDSVELIGKVGEAVDMLRGYHKVDTSFITVNKEFKTIPHDIKNEEPIAFEKEVETFITKDREIGSESRKGKTWTEEEEELITQLFKKGLGIFNIAEKIGRTEIAIKSRLAKLGLIDYTYGQENVSNSQASSSSQGKVDESDFNIENYLSRCTIRNKYGECVFSSDGYLKYISGKLYRINLKKECFTLKKMQFDGYAWVKGEKMIVAYPQSDLYKVINNNSDFLRDIEDVVDSPIFKRSKLKVKGFWYRYNGTLDIDTSASYLNTNKYSRQENISSTIVTGPKYEEKTNVIQRAMRALKEPATPREIARMVGRTALGCHINEESLDSLLKRMPEVEYVKWGKYKLKEK